LVISSSPSDILDDFLSTSTSLPLYANEFLFWKIEFITCGQHLDGILDSSLTMPKLFYNSTGTSLGFGNKCKV
jgi:hypothetical protein